MHTYIHIHTYINMYITYIHFLLLLSSPFPLLIPPFAFQGKQLYLLYILSFFLFSINKKGKEKKEIYLSPFGYIYIYIRGFFFFFTAYIGLK